MRLGICDDNQEDCQKIYQICKETVFKIVKQDCQIIRYNNGDELLHHVTGIDLLILDIELPDINGLEIKKRLQELGEKVIIIFVTNHDELMLSAFGIHVFGFILKKNIDKQLSKMIISAINMIEQYVFIDGVLDSREVKYIKSDRIYCDLFLKNGQKKVTRTSIREYEQLLNKVGFVRTHKTYLVNLMWVDRISDKGIQIGEEVVPIATRQRKQVKNSYQKFCEKNGGYC